MNCSQPRTGMLRSDVLVSENCVVKHHESLESALVACAVCFDLLHTNSLRSRSFDLF
jgi:hypothetical protein